MLVTRDRAAAGAAARLRGGVRKGIGGVSHRLLLQSLVRAAAVVQTLLSPARTFRAAPTLRSERRGVKGAEKMAPPAQLRRASAAVPQAPIP
jgi:hypothetical protein